MSDQIIDCIFEWIDKDNGIVQCIRCGSPHTTKATNPKYIYRNCYAKLKKPRLLKRAIHFTKAIYNHIKEGSPEVSDKVFNKRVSVCESNKCGVYNQGICEHPTCGCIINIPNYPLSKARWKDQHCPLKLWEGDA